MSKTHIAIPKDTAPRIRSLHEQAGIPIVVSVEVFESGEVTIIPSNVSAKELVKILAELAKPDETEGGKATAGADDPVGEPGSRSE